MIGLASTFVSAGKTQNAGNLLRQIDTLMKSRPAISESLKRELDQVRSSAKASLN